MDKRNENDQLSNNDLQVVSQAEAARRLGISKNTLIRIRGIFNIFRLAGKSPTTGTILYNVKELQRFADEYLVERTIVVKEINASKKIKSFVTADSANQVELMSQREAAKYLGISQNTLGRWKAEGLFNFETVKLNKLTLYRKSEIAKAKSESNLFDNRQQRKNRPRRIKSQ